MRPGMLCGLAVLGILSCASSIKEFYPDSYFKEDGIYQNKPLSFSLAFEGSWNIFTDPNNMVRSLKQLAVDHQKEGRELLFVGTTADGLQGVRGIALNLNASTEEYAEMYRNIKTTNNEAISADSGLVAVMANNIPMVRWSYTEYGHQFVEFFFTIDTYNIRIAFWAKPIFFRRFLPVYFAIMSSIELINRF